MTVQVMHPAGGRRFGPTALARTGGQSVPVVPQPRVFPPRRVARAATRRPAPAPLGRRRRALAPCPTGSAGGRYRMGRWARLAMTVVVTAAIVVAMLTVVMRPSVAPTTLVTVGPGDTLTSIVQRDMPGWDPASAMEAVASLNGLAGQSLRVGTVLRIPASR